MVKALYGMSSVAAFLVLSMVGCKDNDQPVEPVEPEVGAVEEDVEADVGAAGRVGDAPLVINEESQDVVENPAAYEGRKVYVRGEVNRVLTSEAFTVDVDGLVGATDVLVLAATKAGVPRQGEMVDVTGTLYAFEVVKLEGVLGADLDEALLVEFTNRAAIAATDIRPARELMH